MRRLNPPRILAILIVVSLLATPARAERIKDVAGFTGDHQWKLIGTGLVIGLGGTGDGSSFQPSLIALANSLERLGVSVDPSQVRSKNVAMVAISADMRSWNRTGARVDVRVSSLGDAKSLEGGTLLPATLVGVTDGEVYGLAAGPVSIGGFNVSGGANNSVQKNHATVGLVTGGGSIERDPPARAPAPMGIMLNHPDRATASNIAQAVNAAFPGSARAQDAGFVELTPPDALREQRTVFEALVGDLRIEVDSRARVVVNERTGTIVVGAGVRLREAAIAHGGLTVEISTRFGVSQPNSFNESGQTTVVPEVSARVNESAAHVIRLPDSATVQDVVDVLNAMGATPRDIIAILQALRTGGSLQAELVTL